MSLNGFVLWLSYTGGQGWGGEYSEHALAVLTSAINARKFVNV